MKCPHVQRVDRREVLVDTANIARCTAAGLRHRVVGDVERRSSSAISSACSAQMKLLESSSTYAIKNFVMGDIQEHRDGLTRKLCVERIK